MLHVDHEVDLGDRIFELRDARGWTQSELARRAGLHRNTISPLEAGSRKRPESPTLRKLARAFGMTVEEFLHGEIDAAKEAAET